MADALGASPADGESLEKENDHEWGPTDLPDDDPQLEHAYEPGGNAEFGTAAQLSFEPGTTESELLGRIRRLST